MNLRTDLLAFLVSVGLSACCLKPAGEPRPDSGPLLLPHDAGPPTGCTIGGSGVAEGARNALNSCQICKRALDPGGWTDLPSGSPCAGGALCFNGACTQGCLIDGGFLPSGTTDEGGCLECAPGISQTSWTDLAEGTRCGVSSEICFTSKTCSAGVCSGAPVACDDGNICTTDTCDKGVGCRNLDHATDCNGTNPCKIYYCDPKTGCQQADATDGTPCTSLAPCLQATACLAGACTGLPLPDGTPCRSPINPCVQDATCQSGICDSPSANALHPGDILWTDVARAYRGPDGGRVLNPNASGFGWRGVASIDDLGNLYLDDDADQSLPELVSLDVCGKERWRVPFASPAEPTNGRHLIFGTLIFSTSEPSSIVGQNSLTGATLWTYDPGATLGKNGTPLPTGAFRIRDVALSNQGIFYYTGVWPSVDEHGVPQIARMIGGVLRNGQSRFQQVLPPVPGDATGPVAFGYPLLADENENLYTGWRDGGGMEVVSFDQLGAFRWSLPLGAPDDGILESFSEDHGLFVEPSHLVAWDSRGNLLWSLGAQGALGTSAGDSPTVALDGTTTILQSVGGVGQVAAFSEAGRALWTFPMPNGEQPRSTHVLDSAGRLYVAGAQGTLFAIDGATGKSIWSVSMDPGLTVQRGGVLGLTPAGSLIVSAVEQLTGVYAGAPMAASPWPRFRGDNRNRSCPTPADTPGLPH